MSRNNNILQYLLLLILFGCLLLCFIGCKCPCVATGGTHSETHDSIHTEYKHDSIYIDRWHKEIVKGDTVFVKDSVWRDRWHYINRHDSVYFNLTDTIVQTIEVEKKGSAFWKGSGIALWCLLGAMVLAACIGLIIKFAK